VCRLLLEKKRPNGIRAWPSARRAPAPDTCAHDFFRPRRDTLSRCSSHSSWIGLVGAIGPVNLISYKTYLISIKQVKSVALGEFFLPGPPRSGYIFDGN